MNKKKLKPASFKGVNFEIEDNSFSSGRRVQTHEYPNRDLPYSEDMGRKKYSFSLEAFVIGPDYLERREKLKEACLSREAGILVHPIDGMINVICEECTITEKVSAYGMSRFSLTFVEKGEKTAPDEVSDWSGKTNNAASNVELSAIDKFKEKFNLKAIGDNALRVSEKISEIASQGIEVLNHLNTQVGYVTSYIGTAMDAANAVTSIMDTAMKLKDNAMSLLDFPDVLAEAFSSIVSGIQEFSKPEDAPKNLEMLLSVLPSTDEMNVNTPKAQNKKESIEQINTLLRQLVLSNEAKSFSKSEYQSPDEAQNALELINTHIDKELEEEEDNTIISALYDMRSAMTYNFEERIKKLPQTKTLILNETTPSLVLAYQLYEDLGRADEICNRNKINNPGFVPAGKKLQVLTK